MAVKGKEQHGFGVRHDTELSKHKSTAALARSQTRRGS